MARRYKCTKCGRTTFTLRKLLQHVGLIHNHEANFSITCGLNGCVSSFKKYESFRRHVYRKHQEEVLPQRHTDVSSDDEDGYDSDINYDNDIDLPLEVRADIPSTDSLLTNFKDSLCMFILKCQEKNNLPQTVQQDILEDVNFLFCFFKENYDAFISYHLKENGFDMSTCPELNEVLQSSDFFEKASAAVRSPYLLKEHCKSKLNLVEPVHHVLRSENGHKITWPVQDFASLWSNFNLKWLPLNLKWQPRVLIQMEKQKVMMVMEASCSSLFASSFVSQPVVAAQGIFGSHVGCTCMC